MLATAISVVLPRGWCRVGLGLRYEPCVLVWFLRLWALRSVEQPWNLPVCILFVNAPFLASYFVIG